MTNKDALTRLHYEKEREENLRTNKLMMEQLFGTMMLQLKIENPNNDKKNNNTNTATKYKAVTSPYSKRNIEKPLTSKEVDMIERNYNSERTNPTPGRVPPPSTVRFVFDHIYISRQTSRQAAREATKAIALSAEMQSGNTQTEERGDYRPEAGDVAVNLSLKRTRIRTRINK
ncbi:hypothetical protein BGZ96_001639 [Linnemannia gamsii]|uniref:Uncharacterized protein n=1 Tax=Linnemannia gamsii TaxID=64522 RepID=A0ABQ7KAR3_9FUNG|nr:hypothetical protein BGZ96_001639 [Linnemannia gamsii]